MRRFPFFALSILLFACGVDGESAAQPTEPSGTFPTGGPVTPVAGERQRLSVAQLLAYLPETADRFAARRLDSSAESDEFDATGAVSGGVTDLTATYEDTEPRSSLSRFAVSLRDPIDEPMTMGYERGQIDGRSYAGMTAGYNGVSFTDGTAGGLATQEMRGASVGPILRMLIADRFIVTVQQAGGDSEIGDFVESSFIPALATAPAFADAGDPPIPEWAATGMALSEERQAPGDREREAEGAEAAAAGTLPPPCDDLLSADDVVSVLGAQVRVVPSPFATEDGSACTRSYLAVGVAGSVILIVSHFTQARQAEGALRVASDHDDKVSLEPLAGGLDGVRYTHDLTPDTHVSHFAQGVDFVELKAAPGLDNAPGVTPDQLADLTAWADGSGSRRGAVARRGFRRACGWKRPTSAPCLRCSASAPPPCPTPVLPRLLPRHPRPPWPDADR
ncbi:hypothetical protein [Rubrivirga sp. IMCC43871]|uniref:hypothetical protein n=1 Tax=Rubrivirga sp. IMCC43871 TaxID=3391575 RepID=UPI00398FB463